MKLKIPHPPSDIRHPISDIRHPPSDIRNQKAFTLIELIVTIVIIGVAVTALTLGFYEKVKSLDFERSAQNATLLADDLAYEIRSKIYEEPTNSFGAEESSPRSNFDDVDDYDGWSESPPRTIEGTAMTDYNGFTRSVIIMNVLTNNLDPAVPEPDGSTSFKRIEVVVSGPEAAITNVSVVSKYD
ncbi:type II secretion system protein [Verrucomicrobiota bacterium]